VQGAYVEANAQKKFFIFLLEKDRLRCSPFLRDCIAVEDCQGSLAGYLVMEAI